MTNAPLEGLSILIVDGQSLSAADISSRLSALGARVHVVTTAARAAAVVRAIVSRFDFRQPIQSKG